MTRADRKSKRTSRGPNLMALFVSATVVGYVYLNTDPVISGTEPAAESSAVIGPPELSLPAQMPAQLKKSRGKDRPSAT